MILGGVQLCCLLGERERKVRAGVDVYRREGKSGKVYWWRRGGSESKAEGGKKVWLLVVVRETDVERLEVERGGSRKIFGSLAAASFWRLDRICRVDTAKQHLGTKEEAEATGDIGDDGALRRSFSEELMRCESRDDKSCIAKCSGCSWAGGGDGGGRSSRPSCSSAGGGDEGGWDRLALGRAEVGGDGGQSSRRSCDGGDRDRRVEAEATAEVGTGGWANCSRAGTIFEKTERKCGASFVSLSEKS
ncbi:hypothetical protein NL676_007372 [Syzygium grande]|nr:hypothetical protein NL676_007372 [Syzygium grande]